MDPDRNGEDDKAVLESPFSISEMDEQDTKVVDNQRLLDPSATPDKLREFAFGVGCPCPTRTMTRETAIALRKLNYPMFGNPIHYSPDGMEVGEARNHIVEQALADGVEWLFFLDYDIIPPSHALIKMLDLLQNSDDKFHIAAGVYYLKQVPSYPLIMVEGWKYAFEDWEAGDLIKADAAGMGCTLINMEVFRKMEKPWFKTCPGYSPKTFAPQSKLTEDVYFCMKAKEAGFNLVVDTSIQCGHVDWRKGLIYHYAPYQDDPKKGGPAWTYRMNGKYVSERLAGADHPHQKWAETEPVGVHKKGIDLGCGGSPKKGFVGVDLYVSGKGIVNGDIEDLSWFRKDFGLVPKIHSSHALEHINHRKTSITFRDWVNTLQPGGTIEVRVPDIEYSMRHLLEACEKEEGKNQEQMIESDYWLATLYGWQIGPGQEHHTGFTKGRLEQLALSSGLVDVKVKKREAKGQDFQQGEFIGDSQELILTGRRPDPEKEGK